MARIEAPHKENGEVTGVGGLVFTNGVATTDDVQLIAYCVEAGYIVDGEQPVEPDPQPDSRKVETVVQVGSPLRDAAVDPEPGDFGVPTGAGAVDPQGPEGVSIGLAGGAVTAPDAEDDSSDEDEHGKKRSSKKS
ncbi:hypothetical protein [Enterococcus hirae]|uniref:hypothetical protein n=1 Tax=Enterococcus hirae TaxID=1354 RepID=UPI00136ECCBA|nr:hypothetical protein [Enterococcus hirae]NAE18074.1 hypothetical protein [Enterococcus hirae]